MTKCKDDIVFISSARTAIGKYLGALKNIKVEKLAEIALKESIKRAKINKDVIDEVIIGNVLGLKNSCNIAKMIAMNLGLKDQCTGMTINRVCGSGIQAAVLGFQELTFKKKKFIAVGGAESLSRAPYFLPPEIRYKNNILGNFEILDSNILLHRNLSGSNSPISHMGITVENLVKKYKISRKDQDKFAYISHMRAYQAQKNGRLDQEIVPISIADNKGNTSIFNKDEQIRADTSIEKLSKLTPCFISNGTITAGNSSSLNDGASFQIMTTREIANADQLEIMAIFKDYSIVGVPAIDMGIGPVCAIKELCENNNIDLINDIDILEIKEAFSGQILSCLKLLSIDIESDYFNNNFNINGGAISLGHPLSMSGSRMITSVLYEFKNHPEKRYAIISACIGGGQGIAILLENAYWEKENEK
ncbi:thiolase family protein [Helcococcus kunzii]